MTNVNDRYRCQYCLSEATTPERPLSPYWGSNHSVAYSFHEDCQLTSFLPQLEGLARIEAVQKILDITIKRTDALLIKSAILGEQLKADLKNIADLKAKLDLAGVPT